VDIHSRLRFTDIMTFTLGVMNTGLTPFFLGSFPTGYYIWHTPKAILLTALRWHDFYQAKQHYLLYDFCYWANFLTLIYIWLVPHNPTVFQVLFMCANGPLAWSVLAFNQSLIFHSYPHITSVFIHTSPMMLSYGLRWYPSTQFSVCQAIDNRIQSSNATTPWELYSLDTSCVESPSVLILDALLYFYLWWVILYYIWVFLVLGQYIEKMGFQTLYDRVTTKGPFSIVMKRIHAPHLIKKAIYIFLHLLFGVVTMIFATFWWNSMVAHIFFYAFDLHCGCVECRIFLFPCF